MNSKSKNPLVAVRFTQEQYDHLFNLAQSKRWSIANLVAYCVEEQITDLPDSQYIKRR